MTEHISVTVTQVAVPPRAMTTAILLATRLGADLSPAHCLNIAREHGGDQAMAEALRLRLSLLAMLLTIDPTINAITAKLTSAAIGTVLADFPVQHTPTGLGFDGDSLAAALRFAADPEGLA